MKAARTSALASRISKTLCSGEKMLLINQVVCRLAQGDSTIKDFPLLPIRSLMSASSMKNPNGPAILAVKVVPGANRDEIVGWIGEALKIRTAQPPEKGRANDAICRLIADAAKLPPSAVKVMSGRTSSHKRIAIAGISYPDVIRLLPANGGSEG